MKSPNLMLHCGADAVRRSDLNNVILPPVTETYTPIGHNTFVDLVQEKLGNIGFNFGTEAHGMTHDGARYFGLAELTCGSEHSDFAMVVGMRNSLDKRFPASLAFGSQVFVCDNLAFSGEIKVSRKHTTHIMRDLPKLIEFAVSHTRLMKDNQEARFEHYRGFRLTTNRADHIICDMVRRGVINTSRVQGVINEWDEPSQDHGGRTAWRLFNAVTEVLKSAPLHDVPPRTVGLHGLLDEVTEFAPKTPEQPDVIDAEFVRLN